MNKTILQRADEIAKLPLDGDFIYGLISVYGKPAATISRLKSGEYNLSENEGEILWKKNLLYRDISRSDAVGESLEYAVMDELQKDVRVQKNKVRFIIVRNGSAFLAYDTKCKDSLDINIKDLSNHVDFFMPWAGVEKSNIQGSEAIADVKASEKMARLYDEIIKNNEIVTDEQIYELNIFFSRLLFCFFAEDTGIFEKDNQFTGAIKNLTKTDGNDVHEIVSEIFKELDREVKDTTVDFLKDFPYVNGKLFGSEIAVPKFNTKARNIILECGDLNWAQINPDIFGSMIQAVVDPSERADLGMHYTSVVNIMKVIQPLFLDDLNAEIDKIRTVQQAAELWTRISEIKVFDPACGSGNFLIIAYKELRKLENIIIRFLITKDAKSQAQGLLMKYQSCIKLENFYGIEINPFAHEVAILSLYLAKHQMNVALAEITHDQESIIPLKDTAHVVEGNAARLDWQQVCPNDGIDEIYLIGNPPYLGAKLQDDDQKHDFKFAYVDKVYSKNLDYISIWFYKGAKYISRTRAELAFVSTNSICQGDHVALLWPDIYSFEVNISFSHTSFKWSNNAKRNAGVTVIIIGFSSDEFLREDKKLYLESSVLSVKNINPYLVSSNRKTIIERQNKSVSKLSPMVFGSMPRDGGHLVLTYQEKKDLIEKNANSAKFIKKYLGSAEFINGKDRYCIWITDEDIENAKKITSICKKLEKVSNFRESSKASSTKDFSKRPHRFVQISFKSTDSIIVPSVSSERREYVPIGFLDKDTIISNAANAIYDAEPYIFGLISSRMHMVWLRAVGGKLEDRLRYSSSIVYNNFPVAELTEKQKEEIASASFEILTAREQFPEKNLAYLYDPETMPQVLRDAHAANDAIIDKLYLNHRDFKSDEERLETLFKLYEEMTSEEKSEKNIKE